MWEIVAPIIDRLVAHHVVLEVTLSHRWLIAVPPLFLNHMASVTPRPSFPSSSLGGEIITTVELVQ